MPLKTTSFQASKKRSLPSSSLPSSSSSSKQQKQQQLKFGYRTILLVSIVVGVGCFYIGLLVGATTAATTSSKSCSNSNNNINNNNDDECWSPTDPRLVSMIQKQVKENVARQTQQLLSLRSNSGSNNQNQQQIDVGGGSSSNELDASSKLRFPQETVGRIASGLSRVNRDEFAALFDTGVPLDASTKGNSEVLILYQHLDSIPSSPTLSYQATAAKSLHDEIPFIESVHDATVNCDNLHIILTDYSRPKQCIAIMGQYESFHIQKFMRLPPDKDQNDNDERAETGGGSGGKLDSSLPLRLVNRGAQSSGRKSSKVPTKDMTVEYWNTILLHYLSNLNTTLEQELSPIAKSVASYSYDSNTIIVMVCNYGQSELLLNFICNANSKHLDLSNVLLFATDQETYDMATSLGLTSFYHPNMFGLNDSTKSMPKQAAKRYADKNFMSMMAAKVFVVQMISMLGYNLLFQDVDVIWYQHPLQWFEEQEKSRNLLFDIYFQDDGNHALFYAPYSANTGFYYVRHNDRTQYFFNSLLLAGDLILSTHSHQIALIALLNEHASMYGLKVKIWERHTSTEFPGGFTFHRKFDYMKDLVSGRLEGTKDMPYIFHMSWTLNKDNKILYYRQMGEWYLQNTCIGSTKDKILRGKADEVGTTSTTMTALCCSTEPLITCHYRDKPSKIPCKDSPPIDKGKPSFW